MNPFSFFSSTKLLWIFAIFQVLVISIFLSVRGETFLTFNHFLQSVKYTTILLLIIAIVNLVSQRKVILKFDKLKFIFALQILILYFTMMIHTDLKAINSPTIFLMLIMILIFFSQPVNEKQINYIALFFSVNNFIFVVLQITKYIPIAQDNVREGLAIVSDRPTGILFNAFAMGYASVITLLICLYFLKKQYLIYLNLLGIVISFISTILSGTRTPFVLLFIFGVLILIQDLKYIRQKSKLIVFFISTGIFLFPFITILIGDLTNRASLSNLNGRTQLWSCITSRWQDFFPFGVGVQAAFPNGFCSDDEWFSKLRHPENMFLLNFVESGIVGLLGLIGLFVLTTFYSYKYLKNGSSLALGLTGTFLLSSLFYVPLFHYLPFLEGRTADRGIYNFFLITILWICVLAIFNSKNIKQQTKK